VKDVQISKQFRWWNAFDDVCGTGWRSLCC